MRRTIRLEDRGDILDQSVGIHGCFFEEQLAMFDARNLLRVFFNFWTRFLWQCSPIDNRLVTVNGKFPDKISRFTRNSHERCDGRL